MQRKGTVDMSSEINKDRISELVLQAQAGNQEVWTELYEIGYKGIHFIAMDFMKNPDDAMDAEQEAVIKIYNNISKLEEPDKFLSWTRQITTNTCKDILRRHRDYTFSETEDAAGLADDDMELQIEDLNVEFKPDEQMDIKETSRIIREMMEELPDEQRVTLDLLYGSELSVKEIAEALDCSENTVKSRLRYGRNAMEEKIEALRKQGTKLYLIPAAALIRLAYRADTEAYAAVMAKDFALKAVSGSSNAAAVNAAENINNAQLAKDMESAADAVNKTAASTDAGAGATAQAPAGAVASEAASAVNTAAAAGTKAAEATAAKAAGTKMAAMIAAAAVAAGGIGGGAYAYMSYQHKQQVAEAESLYAEAESQYDAGDYDAALENLTQVRKMDILEDIDIDSAINEAKDRQHEQELYEAAAAAADDLTDLDLSKDEDAARLSEYLASDAVDEYLELTNQDVIWIPSDTGENVTGYYKNGGIYTGSADNGIRTGSGIWKYGKKTYTGAWSNDKPNGTGTYGTDTSNYTGTFTDGIGNGTFEAYWSKAEEPKRFPVEVVEGEAQIIEVSNSDEFGPFYVIYSPELYHYRGFHNTEDAVIAKVEGLE